ncbi:isoflavone reductase family protein [Aureobasidium pullulans]|uniref:Isoflavone reductase family protein n=1 Tax=Aureobasidium pullulans TaxID=5580 RepID=A0A4S9C3C3_AURPU|nr:isoflavone reductase family protein [Aureobasidium pullulans]
MPSTPTSTNPSPLEPRLYSVTTQELLRALPSRRDVEVLMDLMRASPEVCYQLNYKSHLPMSVKLPNMRAQIPNLLRPETNLVLLARQMLLFAMALQCISPLRQISELSKHHHLIMADLAESAIKTVTTNESLLGSLEGIGNIVLEAIYYMDCGDLRRAWIAMRRAVMAAQLAGLHRRAPHQLRGLDDRNDLDSEIMWNSIIYMERITSLLSGLPTSTGSANIALQEVTNDAVPGQSLHVLIGNAAGRVLERNQIDSSQQALELTEDIDHALIKLAGQMPTAFWRPPEFAGLARDSVEAFNETRRALSHSSYYTLVIQLHMPYMLCQSHASQRTYSKIACVNASREIALQTFNPISSSCRMNEIRERGTATVTAELDESIEELITLLQDIDTVISCMSPASMKLQIPLIDAAVKAGVKRFLPCNFGTPSARGILALRDVKEEFHDHVFRQKLGFTIIDVGFWYQASIPRVPSGRFDSAIFMPLNDVYSGGSTPNMLIDARDVGKMVARIIKDERTLNKRVIAYGDVMSQNEISDCIEDKTGEVLELVEISDTEAQNRLDARKTAYAADPENRSNRFLLAAAQYAVTKYVRGDNTPENARYLGYVSANELYPEFRYNSYTEFVDELLTGKIERPYPDIKLS